ncbi:MAG: hypothetical protein M3Q58_05710 [Bacteroidota bacterium]|nr:hypothetical protein [Bacteroidota bacterium]
MHLSVNYIKLKPQLYFFIFSWYSFLISKNVKKTRNSAIRNTGFWNKLYSMTLWPEEESINAFGSLPDFFILDIIDRT